MSILNFVSYSINYLLNSSNFFIVNLLDYSDSLTYISNFLNSSLSSLLNSFILIYAKFFKSLIYYYIDIILSSKFFLSIKIKSISDLNF